MELHAVHFKSDYSGHEAALRRTDGISILVYFFKVKIDSRVSVTICYWLKLIVAYF